MDRADLEYFFISTRGYFDAICSGIQRGLYLTKKRKREQMEIGLNVNVQEISNAEACVEYFEDNPSAGNVGYRGMDHLRGSD